MDATTSFLTKMFTFYTGGTFADFKSMIGMDLWCTPTINSHLDELIVYTSKEGSLCKPFHFGNSKAKGYEISGVKKEYPIGKILGVEMKNAVLTITTDTGTMAITFSSENVICWTGPVDNGE